jgi:hypothetical protein
MLKKILYILILCPVLHLSQTISFDEFIESGKNALNTKALQTVKNSLPDDIIITADDIGDFSGDGKNDFAIAYRYQHSRDKNILVNLYCDSLSSYVQIFSDSLQFYELPIEIAFNISQNVCYITQKLEDKSWKIVGYSFYKNEFKLVDSYVTEVKSISRRFQFGEEDYINYSDLTSFTGYFDLNSIEQFKKTKFLIFPVYDLKRNIYSGYKHKIIIDDSWKWTADSVSKNNYGSILISKDKDKIIINMDFLKSVLDNINPTEENNIDFYFDRSGKRFIERMTASFGKRVPKFRNAIDDDISHFKISFNLKGSKLPGMEYQLGKNFNYSSKDKIKYEVFPDSINRISLSIPTDVFNLPINNNELGNFISLKLMLRDGSVLNLKSSEGSETDPSSYSRMVFIKDHNYFGVVKNNKFKLLQNKILSNGIIPTPE